MTMSFFSATLLLLLVFDPFGCIPSVLAILEKVDNKRRKIVIVRECTFAFFVLLFFLLSGKTFLDLLHISETSLGIAGGIILFIIALRIIFPDGHGVFGELPEGEPFLVPLAIPLIAGPSAIATTLLLVSRWPERRLEWLLAIILALGISTVVLLLGEASVRLLGKRGILAIERLMGLVLTAIAVEMFLNGIRIFLSTLP